MESIRTFIVDNAAVVGAALALLNVIAFALYGIDKAKAVKKRWRIPEATLLLSAALFGALGAFMGMRVFRHKTQKARFKLGVPALLILQAVLAVLVFVL